MNSKREYRLITGRCFRSLALWLSCCLFCESINETTFAQTGKRQTLAELKNSETGAHVLAFINHINDSHTTASEQIDALFSAGLVERIGYKRLQSVFADIRENDGSLELYEVFAEADSRFRLKAKGTKHGEWLDIGLIVEKQKPFKISGIEGVEITGRGPESNEPMLRPSEPRRREILIPNVNDVTISELDKWLTQKTKANEFSGVVLLAKDYQPVFYKAFGLASKRYHVPNTLETKFRIGSVNKIFTATAILKLVEDGRIGLDDGLEDYVAGFTDPRASEITIRHLLSHSSGLGSYWEHPEYHKNWKKLRSVDDYMKFIKGMQLDFPPGEKTQYSNAGYNVLGAVVEKVSEQDYYSFVRETIFRPFEMDSTDSLAIDRVIENLATCYTNTDVHGQRVGKGFPFEATFVNSIQGTPAGGGYATAADLLTFAEAIDRNELVNEDSELFLRRDMGLRSNPGSLIFHNGGAPGQNAWMQADVESGYTIIVLSNFDPPSASAVVKKIGELMNLAVWGS